MALVSAIEAKGDKAAILVMDDGTRVWTPEKAKADELVGRAIPEAWTQRTGDYGPQALPPKPQKQGGGGFSAFRNTKEGQAIEQEAMDRRTALMQAVAMQGQVGYPWDQLASSMYLWLRATKPSGPVDQGVPAPAVSGTGQHVEGGGAKPVSGSAQILDAQESTSPSTSSDAQSGNTLVGDRGGSVAGNSDTQAEVLAESNTPASSSDAPRGSSDTEEGIRADGEAALVPPSVNEVHIHGWSDTLPDGRKTRDGWVWCEGCGTAEQASKVKATV